MDFNKKFEEIRADRMGVVKSSVYPGLKVLVSQIYPDEAHFIYELLQNAEDAQATEVVFTIKKTKLVFAHNGTRLFDADDVNAITNIAHSTKKDNYVQAGKFGIGFKSVYAFTETPYIYCDSICFKIEKLLLPTEIEPLRGKKEGWTEFHFPFDSPKISADEAKQKIKQGLLEIENTTLLFLNNIVSIKYKLEDGSESCVKKTVDGNVISSVVISGGKQRAQGIWKRFSRQTTLHSKKISVDIAFLLEKGKDTQFKFVAGQDKVCITFLAKNEKSNLKFYINAPFGCTPARDSINKDDHDNQVLINELAILAKSALETLKEENLLTDDFFNVLPIEEDEVPEFYKPIVEAIKSAFVARAFLPTMNDTYCTVGSGIMSSRTVIDKVFTIDDVQYIFKNKRLQFVKNRPVNSRGYKFLKMLNIAELTPMSVLLQMTELDAVYLEKWLNKLSDKQISELYAFLNKGLLDLIRDEEKYESYSYYDDYYYSTSEYYKEEYQYAQQYKRVHKLVDCIKKIRFVRAEDGKLYVPSETRILSQNISVPPEFKLVDKKLIGKSDALGFLKNLGVQEFTEKELEKYLYSQEISDFVKKMNSITGQEDPLEIARLILRFFSEHNTNEVKFGDTKFVWTNMYSGSGKNRKSVLAKPSDCYLDAPYVEETGFSYVEDIHHKKALSDVYALLDANELSRWVDFLKNLGCYYTLSVEQKSYGTGYSTGYHYDYEIRYLEQYLSKKNKHLNRFIWKYLTGPNGWRYSFSHETKKINRNYSSRTEDSSILKAVKNTAWIEDCNGKLCLPTKVSEGTLADGWSVREDNGFLSAINFGEEQRKKEEEIKQKQELERLQLESKQEAAETLGFSSAEDVLAAKENSRIIAELAEYGVDVHEILDSKRKERSKKKYSLQEQLQGLKQNTFKANEVYDDGEVYRVPNPEHRDKILKEEISAEAAPKKKTTVTKKTAVNQEEKHFVGTEYSGRCQICDKVIFKKDGTRHFVAMNLLDTGHLEEEYLSGLSTAWNTLCFCPNCAAEFKYGAVSLFDFVEDVKGTVVDSSYSDYYEFSIEMQGEERVLRYTPRHLMALKAALEYFEESQKNGKADRESSDLTTKSHETVSTEPISIIKAGDRCPSCGVSNVKNQKIQINDINGSIQTIDARVCGCGKVYLTHKMKKNLPTSIPCIEVEGFAPVQTTKKKLPVKMTTNKVGTSKIATRCSSCGMTTSLFSNSGMCWDCYKDMMSSRFD